MFSAFEVSVRYLLIVLLHGSLLDQKINGLKLSEDLSALNIGLQIMIQSSENQVCIMKAHFERFKSVEYGAPSVR